MFASFLCVLVVVQVHLEFIKVCMVRLQRIYEGLQQYQPGEIDKEPQEVQQGYSTEVSEWAWPDTPPSTHARSVVTVYM